MGRRQLPRQVLGCSNRKLVATPELAGERSRSCSNMALPLTSKREGEFVGLPGAEPQDGLALAEQEIRRGTLSRHARDEPLPIISPGQVARENAELQKKMGKEGTGLTGHTENIMSAMRDFFQTRPIELLMSAFRKHDKDGSGALSLPEFQKVVKSLQLGLNDKDAAAMFRMADTDGSGVLEMDEFFLNFRHEGFPREGFFGKKAMRGALSKEDRAVLADTLKMGPLPSIASLDKVFDVIQSKVDQIGSVKSVFRMMDSNHSGKIDKTELADALRPFSFEITDAQVDRTMHAINDMVGLESDKPLTYFSFANAFNSKVNKKSLVDLREERHRSQWAQDQHEYRAKLSQDSFVKSTDQLMQHIATTQVPSQSATESFASSLNASLTITPQRRKSYPKSVPTCMGEFRTDSSKNSCLGPARSESEFSLSSKPESLASRSPDMTSASLPSTTTSSFGLGGNGLSHSGSLSSLHKSRELCRSVSECLNPDMKSSHFLDERERTSPSLKWSMSVGSLQETVEKRESRERKESRLQWLTSTRDAREARHAANVAQLKEKREGSLKLKYGAMQDHLERMTDIQLMRLSQVACNMPDGQRAAKLLDVQTRHATAFLDMPRMCLVR